MMYCCRRGRECVDCIRRSYLERLDKEEKARQGEAAYARKTAKRDDLMQATIHLLTAIVDGSNMNRLFQMAGRMNCALAKLNLR